MEGVPNYAMGLSETNLFEMITKTHLNDLVTENDAQILTVEVRSQFLDAASTKSSPLDRLLQATSSTLDVTTIITGKHRPPPELNFDKLIEDSINADTVLFEDALAKGSLEEGGEYFNDIEEIVAKPAPKVINPTPAPTQLPGLSSGGIGIGMSILIVIGIALATFAVVLGIFVTRKRQREKSRQKSHNFFDHDEDDPLFFDVFSSKKQGIPHPHEVSFGENGNRKSASRRSIETEPMTSSETSNPNYRYSTRRFREDDINHNGNEGDEGNDLSDGDLPIVRKDRMTRGGSKTRVSSRDLQSRQNSSRERNHRMASQTISNSSYSIASETSHRRRSSEESVVGSVTSNFSQHSKFKEVNGFYPPKRRTSTVHSRRRSDIEDEHEDRIRRKYHAKSLSENLTKREREDYASVENHSQPGPSRHYSRTLKSERNISRSGSRRSSKDFGDEKERNTQYCGYNSDKSDNKEFRRERSGHIERYGNSKVPSSFSDDEENVSIASMSTDSTISTKVQLR